MVIRVLSYRNHTISWKSEGKVEKNVGCVMEGSLPAVGAVGFRNSKTTGGLFPIVRKKVIEIRKNFDKNFRKGLYFVVLKKYKFILTNEQKKRIFLGG